jgi:hypothetical protein
MAPGFLDEDINTPEILKLMARLSAILTSCDHQSLTSVHADGGNRSRHLRRDDRSRAR